MNMFRHDLFPFSSDGAGRSEPAITLAQQLQQSRDGLSQLAPPPHVLPQLLDAFEQVHRTTLQPAARRPPLRQRAWAWLARLSPLGVGGPDPAGSAGNGPRWATACLLAMTVGLIVLMQPGLPGGNDAGGEPSWAHSGFVPLVPAGSMARTGAAWLVQAELSQANLASMGAPYDPSRAGDTVRAELLVDARGDVLAVRLP